MSGHPGGQKLYEKLRREFYWPSMAVEAYSTVRNCVECAKNRITLRKHASHLKLFPAQAPLEYVAIDILGPLLTSRRKNRYLLVIVDRFSKLVRTVPMRNETAATVARAFVTHWVFAYGPPLDLLSDNGPQFASRLFQETCTLLGIKNVFTTTYHPQCNGQAERFNRTILASLRTYVADHPNDWDLFTDALTYAYNTQPHKSTGTAPFELVLSRMPPSLVLRREPEMVREQNSATSHSIWRNWLKAQIEAAGQQMLKTQERYRRNYDDRLRKQRSAIVAGSLVFLRKDHRDPGVRSHKLAPVVTGPHKVVEHDDHTVVIELGNQHERVSRDRVVTCPRPSQTPLRGGVHSPAQGRLHYNPDSGQPSYEPVQGSRPTAPAGLADLPKKGTCRPSGATGVVVRRWYEARAAQQHPARAASAPQQPSRADVTTSSAPVNGETPPLGGTVMGNTPSSAPIGQPTQWAEQAKRRSEIDQPIKAAEPQGSEIHHGSTLTAHGDNPIAGPFAGYDSGDPPPPHSATAHDSQRAGSNEHREYTANAVQPPSMGHPGSQGVGTPCPQGGEADSRTPGEVASRQPPNVGKANDVLGRTYDRPDASPDGAGNRSDALDSETEGETRDYVIDKVVDVGVARYSTLFTKRGDPVFRVRWYGYKAEDDTWEPVRHIPRSHLVRYCRRANKPLPRNIGEARRG